MEINNEFCEFVVQMDKWVDALEAGERVDFFDLYEYNNRTHFDICFHFFFSYWPLQNRIYRNRFGRTAKFGDELIKLDRSWLTTMAMILWEELDGDNVPEMLDKIETAMLLAYSESEEPMEEPTEEEMARCWEVMQEAIRQSTAALSANA